MEWRASNPTPYSFQQRVLREAASGGLKWDVLINGAAGVGKTWLSVEIGRRTQGGGPILVMTLAKVRRQFALEMHKWFEDCKVAVLEGETPRMDWVADDPDVVIISHTVLPHWKNVLVRWVRQKKATVVIDEIQELASHKRWEMRRDVRGDESWHRLENQAAAAEDIAAPAYRRIALSATPQRKDRPSLWGVLRTLYGEQVIPAYSEWTARFCVFEPGEYGGKVYVGGKNTAELRAFLKARTIFVTKEELAAEIPPLVIERRNIAERDQWNHGILKEFKAAAKRAAREGPQAMLELRVAEAAYKKRKYVIENAAATAAAGFNAAVAVNRIEEAKYLAAAIRKELAAIGEKAPVYLYHGEQTDKTRNDSIDRFMSKDTSGKVFVFTSQSGGTGLNIDNAHRAYIAAVPTTTEQLIQLLGRFHRASTTHNVFIEILLADGTIDDRLCELLLPRLDDYKDVWANKEAGHLTDVIGAKSDEEIQAELLSAFIRNDAPDNS